MGKKRGRKRTINHAEVVRYAKAHPELYQDDVAERFGLTQTHVSRILRAAGVSSTTKSQGNNVKKKATQSEEQFYWEKQLLESGLGMDRGTRLHNQRLLYGYSDDSTFEVKEA